MIKHSKIKSPTFVVNKDIASKNISTMLNKLPETVTFRPHFKTHNNKRTAELFRDIGVTKITVSSIDMAIYFRQLGFKDITIAFPVNIREQKALNKLCVNTILSLTFSNQTSIEIISKLPNIKADAWIEINTGYNRSGIDYKDKKQITECINIIAQSKNLKFKGFLSHNGSTYTLNNDNDILKSSQKEIQNLNELKNKFAEFYPLISVGDTPACSLMSNFNDVDEIRPGNFVYYDLMMLQKGVCSIDDIAATVFCPIVDINPDRNELVIHGGAVHFSKEYIDIDDCKVFGKAIRHIGKETAQIDEKITSLSQEHGIVRIGKSAIKQYSIGDLIEVIPVHSCLTANLMKGKTLH